MKAQNEMKRKKRRNYHEQLTHVKKGAKLNKPERKRVEWVAVD